MKIFHCVVSLAVASSMMLTAQQANINLDYNPQKNTENLIPFGATLNSPDVKDDGTVTFRLKAPLAKEVQLSGVALLVALGMPARPSLSPRVMTESGRLPWAAQARHVHLQLHR